MARIRAWRPCRSMHIPTPSPLSLVNKGLNVRQLCKTSSINILILHALCNGTKLSCIHAREAFQKGVQAVIHTLTSYYADI